MKSFWKKKVSLVAAVVLVAVMMGFAMPAGHEDVYAVSLEQNIGSVECFEGCGDGCVDALFSETVAPRACSCNMDFPLRDPLLCICWMLW